jgi:hypothetical protein
MAAAMVQMSIGPQLDELAGGLDPDNVLQVLAVDPTCGAGVFLVQAAPAADKAYFQVQASAWTSSSSRAARSAISSSWTRKPPPSLTCFSFQSSSSAVA